MIEGSARDFRPASGDAGHSSVLKRIGKNVGWLSASAGISAVASLVYIALTARALGPAAFGVFALVMTYGEVVSNLVQFQSWKAVVAFGAQHHSAGDRQRLAGIFGYALIMDLGGALFGLVLVVLCAPLASALLHWSSAEARMAILFAATLLLSSSTAPAGALRLFDRFDLIVLSEFVPQITRLVGCALGWAIGADVGWFLVVWGLAALLLLASQWIAVLSLGHRFSLSLGSLRMTAREDRSLWPFMLRTNVSNSLSAFWMQLGTLAVGAVVGPVQAGGFRLAHRFSLAMVKPVEIATRAVFPELARLVANGGHGTMRRVLRRVTGVAVALGCTIVLAAGVFGREILSLIAGPRFGFAHEFLFLLSIGAAINVAGFALQPFLNAHRRSGMVLRAYAMSALAYGLLLVLLMPPFRADGAAFAAIGGALVLTGQLAAATLPMVREAD